MRHQGEDFAERNLLGYNVIIDVILPPSKWQTYVTTIHCDFISDHVSLMVKNDWTSQCTWYKKYKEAGLRKQKENQAG